MLDKMSPNQRLLVAVALSVVFFAAYTAIFPPEQVDFEDAQTSQKVGVNQNSEQTSFQDRVVDAVVGHDVSNEEEISVGASNDIVTVTNENFILKLDTLGRISSKVLLQDKFNDKEEKHSQLIPAFATKPLFIRFAEPDLNKQASSVAYTASVKEIALAGEPQKVTLTQKLSTLTVTKELTFYADGHYDAVVSLSEDKRYFIYLGQRPEITEQMMTISGAMVYTDDEIVTIIEDGDAEGRQVFSGVELISAFDQYSATIMYGFAKDTNIIIERDRDDNPVVYFDALQTMSFNGYVGQKEYKVLDNINPVLTNAIEYGWFTFASKPLFQFLMWLHDIFGNWGWSIVALTFSVRIILYPLTFKGMMSMQKIKKISPQIKELQAKHKGDPQRMNKAVMDMYKKHNANPLGGCLPMLMQIPVFFAIYRVLLNAVELQGAEWIFWIDDLSRMDNFYILPLLMGASMYYQQKLTPSNFTDPMQEKVFKFLPVIFTFFFITFPSGLVLYWFVNNLFSIGQQFIVNAQFKNANEAEEALARAKKSDKSDKKISEKKDD
ncbi:membrane protein insertase YidC [Sulfurimonas sp.]|uniref:membrane protein insertase YidC n=1 Tax=Sulfurimonas sp. TaxID=2022749 RepID=UPI0039E5C777